MLDLIIGGALMAAGIYSKSKENMSASSANYDKMNREEKICSLGEGAENWMKKEIEERKKAKRKRLKTMSNSEIRNGLRNYSESDWQYELVYEEAKRRGLV